MKKPIFFGLHADPTKKIRIVLALIPFIILVSAYLIASDLRNKENPDDKLLPTISKMVASVEKLAFTENKRTGEYILWQDTAASLKRLITGVGLAAICGLLLGLNMGMYKGISAVTSPFITFISMIPPLAILPILFISFGVGELGKIVLIFLGVFPIITRDIYLATGKIPREQVVKALTLGASGFTIVYRIILPQIFPRLIDTVRLSLGSAWLFLIASEAIAATEGLGYRIFLVRRYMSMDTIIPYVLWITALGFLMDYLLRMLVKKKFNWYLPQVK